MNSTMIPGYDVFGSSQLPDVQIVKSNRLANGYGKLFTMNAVDQIHFLFIKIIHLCTSFQYDII